MQTTVAQLISNFASACRSLTPSLEFAGVPWLDEEQYDNWDRIAEALFYSLVAEPCVFAAVGEGRQQELNLARYGFAHSSDCNAWIAPATNLAQRFLCLSSTGSPFDRARFEGPAETLSLNGLDLVFVFQADDSLRQLDVIDLAAS